MQPHNTRFSSSLQLCATLRFTLAKNNSVGRRRRAPAFSNCFCHRMSKGGLMKDLSRVLEAVMKIIISIKRGQPSVAILWLSDTNFNLLEMPGMCQYLFSGSEQAALGASAFPKKQNHSQDRWTQAYTLTFTQTREAQPSLHALWCTRVPSHHSSIWRTEQTVSPFGEQKPRLEPTDSQH